MARYRGFSSHEFKTSKNFRVKDSNLIEMDLLNHIFTRRGSRVMMPTFGTVIPDLIFEPLDDHTIEAVQTEIEKVIEYDPRVAQKNISVAPDYQNNTVVVSVLIDYLELDMEDRFELQLDFPE